MKMIESWDFNFETLVYKIFRPFRFSKPERSFLLLLFILFSGSILSQNKLQKELSAAHIKTITINGNQIFNISVVTTKTDKITIVSILDGEYQNEFQIVSTEADETLNLSLEHLSFTDIPDDKRNAHKVIAATLQLEIPEALELSVFSDIGSVELVGHFKSLFIELQQGQCQVKGEAQTATINTLDGDIKVMTKTANIDAVSNHGHLIIDDSFSISPNNNSFKDPTWTMRSINGNITVVMKD